MHPDSKIIDAFGGTMKLANLCQVRSASVSEWRRKGIPRARRMYLKLLRPDLAEIFGSDPEPATRKLAKKQVA